jgi:hypothetical protein
MQTHVGEPLEEFQIKVMLDFLEHGGCLELSDRAAMEAAIEHRKQELLTGLANPLAKKWTKKLRKEVEPLLRMRFCPRFGYVIDRWVAEMGYWHQIPGTCGFEGPRPGLCERMKTQYDMWKKSSPKEDQDAMAGKARHPILKEKDQQSAKVIQENERKATEKVLAAVDSLSAKQIENFVTVERARHTGEKIIHHGQDLRFMEMLEEKEKTGTAAEVSPDMGPDCANPGLNPKLYKRPSGGKHIHE